MFTREQQRLHNQVKKKKECELSSKSINIRELEEQRRREGLEKTIDSNNKGFSLLQKMGYKPGSGIGKNSKKFKFEMLTCSYFLYFISFYEIVVGPNPSA